MSLDSDYTQRIRHSEIESHSVSIFLSLFLAVTLDFSVTQTCLQISCRQIIRQMSFNALFFQLFS